MAPSQKRKIAYLEESDDDEPSLGRQVLPVANLPNDFNGEPSDGLQYLFMVRRDARSLPHITHVANPYAIDEVACVKAEDKVAGEDPVRSSLPSEKWQEVFLRRFKNLRKNYIQSTIHTHNHAAGKLTPDKKDRDAWWAFVSGRPESEWNPPKKPKQSKASRYAKEQRYGGGMRAFSENADFGRENTAESMDIAHAADGEPSEHQSSLPTPMPTPVPEVAESHLKSAILLIREPTPTIIQNIDHSYAVHLVMYFTHWINLYLEEPDRRTYQINDAHACWMFILLSRVEDYVSADEMSTLRSLARACIALIKHIRDADCAADAARSGTSTPMHELSGWLIITAIAGIWGQRDLWLEAETTLASA